jgi:predicted RNA-binding protein with TRAM domain
MQNHLLFNGKDAQILVAGQVNKFKAKAGSRYRILKIVDDNETQLLEDVVAKRQANDLSLSYADGTEVVLLDYYVECADAVANDVTLPAENPGGYSLNSASPSGVSLDSSSNLLYAYGSHDAIYAMAQSNPAMQSAFKEIGGTQLGYLPTTDAFAYSPGLVAIVDGALLGLMAFGVSAGGTAAVPGNNIISGTVVAGPIVVNNGLSVAIYSADGSKLLGSSKVSDSGTYRVDVGSYSGVVIAKLIDDDPVGGNNVDYIDEATGSARDITAKFMSVGEVIPGTSNLNINALTTVAASKAGVVYADPISGSLLAPTATPVAATTVQQVTSAIAKAFGLTDLHGNSIVTTVDISGKANAAYTPATPTPAMNYGAVLAALSGADASNGGNMQTTVDALISNITVTGSTAKLSDSAINTIMVGARVATDTTSGADASRLTAIVSNLTVQASTSIAIDHIAVDDVINSAEQNALISGTTVSGAAVKLSLGGNTRNATVTGTHWEYTLVPADMAGMQEGGETITATATLSGGGTAVATRGIVVDTVAPANAVGVAVSGTGGGNATTSSTPTITGSAEAGTTVKLIENSVPLGTGTTAANGQWKITSNKLSEGGHTIGVNLTDPAGNENPNAGSITLVVDTTSPLNASNISVLGVGAGNVTNDTTPTLTGTAEPGSTVKIYDSNGTTLLGESTTDANGNWRVTSSTLSNGIHSIVIKLSDAAGNTNANAGAIDVSIDTTAPDAVANVLVSGATGGLSKSSTPVLTGTGEPGSTIKLYDTDGTTLLGTTTADSNGKWSITSNSLAEGTHTLIIKVTDAAGNTNSSAGTLNLTVDTTAPQATIDSISTSTISGTCEAGASVNVQVANGTIVPATVTGSTWSFTFSAADISVITTAASTLLNISASDAAGNTASISRNVSATQFSPPSIVEFIPTDGGTLTNGLSNTVELQLTFSEAVLKGSGNLTLYNLADNSVFESIPVTSNQVTINGTESKNVIINTSAAMTLNNQYYVTMDAGTFKDLQGNNFAGQATPGTAGWNFTVASASIKATAVATDNMINANEAGGIISLQGTIVSSSAIVGAIKLSDITVSVTENNSTTTLATTLSSYDSATGVFVANLPAASWVDGKTYTYAYSLSGTTGAAANVTANYSFNKLFADLTVPATKAFITTLNDDVAGITGTLNSGFTCNDTAPVLSGRLSQILQTGEHLVLYRNEGGGNTRLSNDNGFSIVGTTWTYSEAGLINGKTYTYQAVIEDAAGNQSTPGSNFIVSIDTVAPTVSQIAITSANGMQNGYLNAGDSVNLTVTFSKATIVSGKPQLALLIGNSTVFAEYVSGSGTSDLIFSYTIQADQTDLNGISVNANSLSLNGGSFADSAGNAAVLSHSALVDNGAFQVDNSSPANAAAITVSGAGANNLINIVTPTLTGTGEAGSTVKVYATDGTLLGSGVVDSSGNWRIITTTLPQGTQTVSLTITDAAGNINTTAGSVSLTVDTVAPSSSLAISLLNDTGANATDKITSDGTLKVSGADTNVTVEYSNNNETWAGSITPTEGKNMVYVRQTDVAGNSSASSVFYFELDRTSSLPPLIGNIANDNIINELENNISVSGSAEAGSTIILSLGGNARTVTADASGSWSYTLIAADISAMGQGAETLSVTATDAAGNTSTAGSKNISIDTVAPTANFGTATDNVGSVTGTLVNGARTDDTALELSGSCEAGSTVNVYDGSTLLGAASVTGSSWRYTATLANGSTYQFNVKETDSAGNTSAATGNFTVIGDMTASAAPTINVVATDDIISATEQTAVISGSAEANSTIALTLGGNTRTLTADAGGNWSYTLTSSDITAMGQGAETLSATATDAAGNTGSAGTRSITLNTDGTTGTIPDTTPPGAPLFSVVATDNIINAGEQTAVISGSAEANSTLALNLGGNTRTITADASGSWSYTLIEADISAMGQGAETLSVTATDAAGNTGSAGTKNISIDTVTPTANFGTATDNVGSVTGALANGARTDDTALELSGSCEAGSTVNVYNGSTLLGATSVTGSSWRYTATVANGSTYQFNVKETDSAGNSSAASSNFTVMGDMAAPAAPTINVVATDDIVNAAEQTANITGSAEANATVKLTLGGNARTLTADASGNWNYTLTSTDLTAMGQGAETLSVTATDAAGNTGSAGSKNISIDTVAPTANFGSATDNAGSVTGALANGARTDDTSLVLVGSCETGSSVNVYDGSTLLGAASVTGTSWRYTATVSNGTTYQFNVKETDSAGNTSAASSNFTVIGDMTAPTANLGSANDNVGSVTGTLANGARTDDTALELSGSCEAGSTVNVYDGSTLLGAASVTGTSWSCTATVSNGTTYQFNVKETDSAGNTSAASSNFTVTGDMTAPTANFGTATDNVGSVTGTLVNGARTDDTALELSGSCEAGSTVNVYNGSNLLGAASVTGSSWRYTATVANGSTYQFNVKETDSTGNSSAATGNFSVISDSAAPAVPIINVVAGDDILSGSEQSAVISGTAEANSTIALTLGGNTRTLTADAGGIWSYTLTSSDITAMGQGAETLSVTATDAAGNTGSAGTRSITLNTDGTTGTVPDTTPPGAPLLNIVATDNIINAGEQTAVISGSAEANSSIALTLGGNTRSLTADANGIWNYTLTSTDITAMGQGAETLSVTATDAAGNTGSAGSKNISIDTVSPTANFGSATDNLGSVTGTLVNGARTDDTALELSGSCETGSSVNVYDGSTLLGAASVTGTSWRYTATLANGSTYQFNVKETDSAGNSSAASSNFTVMGDMAAPAAPTINVVATDDIVNAAEQTANITGSAEANATVKLTLGGNARTLTADASGNWNYTLTSTDLTAMGQGAETLSVTATDAAGNTGSAGSKNISIDTVAPTANFGSATDNAGSVTGALANGARTDDTSLVLVGSCETGSSVNVYDGSTLLGAASVTGTSWRYTATVSNGTTYQFNVKETDSAGNTSAASSNFTVIGDMTAPTANLGSANDNVGSVTGTLANGARTDDTALELSGSCEAGSTVNVYDGSTLLGAASVTGTSWSCTATVSNGTTYQFNVKETDSAGNTSAASSNFTVTGDMTAPTANFGTATDNVGSVTGTLVNGARTDDTALELTGSCEAGSTVNVYDGSTLLGAASVTGSSWRYTATVANGSTYQFNVKETDSAGNTSAATGNFTVIGDMTAPAAPTINVVATDDIISATEQTAVISGSAEANSTIALTLGGNTRTITADASGNWSYALIAADITAMGQGAETLSATATDVAGNTGSAGTRSITLNTDGTTGTTPDTTPPGAPLFNNVATDNIINAGEQTAVISGSAEANSTLALNLGGNTRTITADASGSWSYTLIEADITAMGQGAETLSVTATDAAGNTGSAGTKNISIDTVTPTANFGSATDNVGSVTGALANGARTDDTALELSGSCEAGSTVNVYNGSTLLGAASVTGSSWRYTATLANGSTYQFNVKETDSAGNSSAATGNFTVMGDMAAPGVPTINTVATDDLVNAAEQTANITGSAEANSTIALTLGGNARMLTADASGNWSYTLTSADITAMGQGAETLSVTATDAAGNAGSAGSKNISIDTVAPTAPVINKVAGDDLVTLGEESSIVSGTAEASAIVKLTLGGNTRTLTADANGNWSYTLIAADITAMGHGAETLSATATDTVGNISPAGTRSITVSVIPAIELSDIAAGIGGFVINGQVAGDQSGYSVASAGDVNGDGLADLIIGANTSDPNGLSSAGRSYVVFGKTTNTSIDLSAVAAGTGGFVVNGQSANDFSGASVSSIGDINNDGLSDLLIGAYQADPSSGSNAGRSYVVFGKTSTTAIELSSIVAGNGGFVINGQNASDWSGVSVSAAGDVNHDGITDLIIGANYSDPVSGANAGRTYLVFGKTSGTAIELSTIATGVGGFVINGEKSNDSSGYSVSAAGDVNNDGLSDLLVGSLQSDPNGVSNAGRSFVVFGKTDSTAVDLASVAAGNGGFVINGQSANDYSGNSVTGIGDVNGDGRADILVGAYQSDPAGGTNAGRSYVVFGKADTASVNLSSVANGQGGFVINGQSANDYSGVSVAAAGDVNGDGLADMIIGAFQADPASGSNAGRSYVVFGKADNTAIDLSAVALGLGGFVVNGQSINDASGYSVSAAGDVNGDGLADLLVGAYQSDPTTAMSNAGRSYVIFGSTSGAFKHSAVDQLGGDQADALTGSVNAETLVGGNGNDTLVGNGGADVLYGGAGNDIIQLNASNLAALAANFGVGGNDTQLARINGGAGLDILKLDGSGLTLDLTAISNQAGITPASSSRIESMETIDLSGTGNNTLILKTEDVLDISGSNLINSGNQAALGWTNGSYSFSAQEARHQLLVTGDSGDVIQLSGGASWTSAGTVSNSGHTYSVYIHNTMPAELLIDQLLSYNTLA